MHDPIDEAAPNFSMPRCLRVPIAASSVQTVERYVGIIEQQLVGRDGRVNAMLVRPYRVGMPAEPQARLWFHEEKERFAQCLYPPRQVWVHVDYTQYRKAYFRFGMPLLPPHFVLDHTQNRNATRLHEYAHPYLRLAPVSRRVNSIAGHRTGTEGMEKANALADRQSEEKWSEMVAFVKSFSIVYADPIDLTKMLDISPGTKELRGVAEVLNLFYC